MSDRNLIFSLSYWFNLYIYIFSFERKFTFMTSDFGWTSFGVLNMSYCLLSPWQKVKRYRLENNKKYRLLDRLCGCTWWNKLRPQNKRHLWPLSCCTLASIQQRAKLFGFRPRSYEPALERFWPLHWKLLPYWIFIILFSWAAGSETDRRVLMQPGV